ncbi:hypothetical protein [Stenotrophomonas pigmentata]|uniref:hypothetical protein n=1 Tax=Stenotrophomonas pigmentata TaxID=3055080 RepID=UPI0026E98BB2|nr:hypothetical protein [Stenotrophomonas sp. 610A2]
MRAFLRGLLAVVLGLIAGSAVNMGLILLGGHLVPPPAGTDTSTTEGLQAAMPLFEARHFLFPFLAHALGTLAGALLATWIVGRSSKVPALLIGLLFLAGGIASCFMLPAPRWFEVLDVLLAYIPFAWLGYQIAKKPAGTVGAA